MSGATFTPFVLKGLGCRQREWLKLEGENPSKLSSERTEGNEFVLNVPPSYYNIRPVTRLFPIAEHPDEPKQESKVHGAVSANANGHRSGPVPMEISNGVPSTGKKVHANNDRTPGQPPSTNPGFNPSPAIANPSSQQPLSAGLIAPPVRSKTSAIKPPHANPKQASTNKKPDTSTTAQKPLSAQGRQGSATKGTPVGASGPINAQLPNGSAGPRQVGSKSKNQKQSALNPRYKLSSNPTDPSFATKLVSSQRPLYPFHDSTGQPPSWMLDNLKSAPVFQHLPTSSSVRGATPAKLSASLGELEMAAGAKSKKRVPDDSNTRKSSELKRAKSVSHIEKTFTPGDEQLNRAKSTANIHAQKLRTQNLDANDIVKDVEMEPAALSLQQTPSSNRKHSDLQWGKNMMEIFLSTLCVFARKSSILSPKKLKDQDIAIFYEEALSVYQTTFGEERVSGPNAFAPAEQAQGVVEPMEIVETREREGTRQTRIATGNSRDSLASSSNIPVDDLRNVMNLIFEWNEMTVKAVPGALKKMAHGSDLLEQVGKSLVEDGPQRFTDEHVMRLLMYFGRATECTAYLVKFVKEAEVRSGFQFGYAMLVLRRFTRWVRQVFSRLEKHFNRVHKLPSDNPERMKLMDALVTFSNESFELNNKYNSTGKGCKSASRTLKELMKFANTEKNKQSHYKKTWNKIHDNVSVFVHRFRAVSSEINKLSSEKSSRQQGKQSAKSLDAGASNQTGRSPNKNSSKNSSADGIPSVPGKTSIDLGASGSVNMPPPGSRERVEKASTNATRTKPGNDRQVPPAPVTSMETRPKPPSASVAKDIGSSEQVPMAVDTEGVTVRRVPHHGPSPDQSRKHAPPLRSVPLVQPGSAAAIANKEPGSANGNQTSEANPAQTHGPRRPTGQASTMSGRTTGILRSGTRPPRRRQEVSFTQLSLSKAQYQPGVLQKHPKGVIETLFSDQGVRHASTLLDPSNMHQREAVDERIEEMTIGSVLAFFGVTRKFVEGVYKSRKLQNSTGQSAPIAPPTFVELYDARELHRRARVTHNE